MSKIGNSSVNGVMAGALLGCAVACGGEDPARGVVVLPNDPSLFPPESGSCTMSHPPNAVTTTARWDKATLTFELGNLYWKLDGEARVVEYGQLDRQWRHLMTYDGGGTLSAFVYEWQGAETPENSWNQQNQYDPSGRLIESLLIYRSGRQRTTRSYSYQDGLLSEIVYRQEYDGTVSEAWTRLVRQGAGVVERLHGTGSETYSRDVAFFDLAGRVTRVDADGAGMTRVDGTPDVRTQWTYDAAGACVRVEQDGDTQFDAPFVDGIPDYVTQFDPGCASIAVLPEELYLFQDWENPR